MTLLLKFLHRVRIHGGDSGAIARALHHVAYTKGITSHRRASRSLISDEKAFSCASAELETVSRSTIERKQMSTKTTLKRIALVAVSALSFGLVVAAPSQAAALGGTGTLTQGTAYPARANAVFYQPVTYTIATGALATGDTVILGASLLAKPTGSAVASTSATFEASAANATFAAGASSNFGTMTVAAGRNAKTTFGLNFKFTPDVAGTYQFLVYSNAALNAAYAAGNPSTVVTVTVASGAPSTATLTSLGGSTSVAETTDGAAFEIVLKDAAGNVTVPNAFESVAISYISSGSSTVTMDDYTATSTTTLILDESEFKGGAAYFNAWIAGAVAADDIVTFTARVTGATTATLGTASVTYKNPGAASATGVISLASTSTANKGGYGTVAGGAIAVDPSLTSHSWSYTVAAGAAGVARVFGLLVNDTGLGIIGGGTYVVPVTVAADKTSADFSIAGGWISGIGYTVTPVANVTAATALAVTATSNTAYTATVSLPAAAVTSATGGSTTFTTTVTNVYGVGQSNVIVQVAQSGRNAKTTVTNLLTNSSGQVTYTVTDSSTSTTNLTDTVTFTPTGGTANNAAAGTINYVANLVIGTVTVTGGSTADTAAWPAVGSSSYAINTGTSGAAGSTVTFTATVKDANGNIISGVPVTWTVDKATSGITKSATADASVCYTNGVGTCTTTVYAWEAPSKVTVTATAGGKSGSGYANFVNAAADARVVSATAVGNVVTAKVVDRYGNPVAAVNLTASTTAGYFGTGANTALGATGANGTVQFVLLGPNSATVTVTGSAATYGQLDDAAGKIGATAITAAVAGTSTGVGSSLAPAGVESATAAVTVVPDTAALDAANAASDAAAEAIDAANAATDAANLAAEAADAATVAAEEARDAADAATAAVEELATQVATLMAALKAQITTLANTVAKIAKKVRA